MVTQSDVEYSMKGACGYVIRQDNLNDVLENMNPDEVLKYRSNGLVSHLETDMTWSVEKAEEEIIELLSRYGNPGDFMLAGRGTSVIERPWIQKNMPLLFRWYAENQLMDLSTMSYLIGYAGLTDMLEPQFPEPLVGRAMTDSIRFCQEYQLYHHVLRAIPIGEQNGNL